MELISNKLYSHNQYLQEDAIDEISILLQRMDADGHSNMEGSSSKKNTSNPGGSDNIMGSNGASGQQSNQGYGAAGANQSWLQNPQFLDSIILKVADVFANSTNQLRA